MTDDNRQQDHPHLSWRDIGAALRYPARRQALSFLAASALGLTITPLAGALLGPATHQAARAALLALSGASGLAALVMLPSFLVTVIKRSAAGGAGCPGWPQLADPGALAGTAFKTYAVTAWSSLPAALYLLSLDHPGAGPSLPLLAVLCALTGIYLPMSLLRLAITGKLWPSLLPSNVIDPIVRTFSSYWMLCLLALAGALSLPALLLLARLPAIGPSLATFGWLYLSAAAMATLGGFYRAARGRLDWEGEA